ncbi:MAG: hypothetical protein LC117_03005 [Bacteroidia bacterium]|nr:hypothetical protein [Bacteroidia bacterium]MCZ2276882.1 hypothetical protein [Bacteroidia bacterium]
MKLTYLLLILVVFAGGCKTTKLGDTETANNPERQITDYSSLDAGPSESVQSVEMKDKLKQTKWRLIVSFISIGEGTDLAAQEQFDKYIDEWRKNKGMNVSYLSVPWGREGEVDFCFRLDEMDSSLSAQFISGMKDRLKGSSLIRISEYEQCRNMR